MELQKEFLILEDKKNHYITFKLTPENKESFYFQVRHTTKPITSGVKNTLNFIEEIYTKYNNRMPNLELPKGTYKELKKELRAWY